jgi:hypothetical protein
MRIVVGSESSRDLRHAELDQHLEILSEFIGRVEASADEPRELTMIVRSAASAPAHALIVMARDLARARVTAKVVVAKMEPEDNLRRLYASLTELSPRAQSQDLIRWTRNPRLLEAHEQVTCGDSLCWSGDCMRRDADKLNALSLFQDASGGMVRLGQLAFGALWSASTTVAERRLIGSPLPKPSGAFERNAETVTAVSALRASLMGWPLLRH